MTSNNPNPTFFGGTAYLGMPFNENFRKLVFRGMEIYGINHGASRNNNVTLKIFSEAEEAASKRFFSDDSIIVSSGYLAVQLVIQHYLPSHQFIYAPESHPALYLGEPVKSKLSYSLWIEETIELINGSKQPFLIISNALNNLVPEIYDFSWLSRVKSDQEIIILVDDSHGLGIIGEKGEGSYSKIPKLPNIQNIVVSSMAKAMGLDAGIILAESTIIKSLRNSSIYAGSSPPSPGFLFAFVHSQEIHLSELQKLRQNVNYFIELIGHESGLFYTNSFPVFLIKNESLAEFLIEKGINISSFPYPDPKGKKLNRIVISSIHKTEEIELLASLINEFNKAKT